MSVEQAQVVASWAAVASVIVALVGFGLIHRQLRLSRRAAEAYNHTAVYQIAFDIYMKLVDNPNVRGCFYDGLALPTDEIERHKVLSFAELFCDFFEYILIEKGTMNRKMFMSWDAYMADMFRTSVAIQHFVNSRRHQYTAEFLAVYDAAYRHSPTAIDGSRRVLL